MKNKKPAITTIEDAIEPLKRQLIEYPLIEQIIENKTLDHSMFCKDKFNKYILAAGKTKNPITKIAPVISNVITVVKEVITINTVCQNFVLIPIL